MSTFDESKIRRAGDGKFSNKDAQRDSQGQVDFDDVEHCPLCGDPIDYCQGHGEWNQSEGIEAYDVEIGDRVWGVGEVSGMTEQNGLVTLEGKEGNAMHVDADAIVQVLPGEHRAYDPGTYGGDHSVGKEMHVRHEWPGPAAHPGSTLRADEVTYVTARLDSDDEYQTDDGWVLPADRDMDRDEHEAALRQHRSPSLSYAVTSRTDYSLVDAEGNEISSLTESDDWAHPQTFRTLDAAEGHARANASSKEHYDRAAVLREMGFPPGLQGRSRGGR